MTTLIAVPLPADLLYIAAHYLAACYLDCTAALANDGDAPSGKFWAEAATEQPQIEAVGAICAQALAAKTVPVFTTDQIAYLTDFWDAEWAWNVDNHPEARTVIAALSDLHVTFQDVARQIQSAGRGAETA